ncbi:MAG: SUMF1/EgtB/PvdO family nonheme iron enzyme [Phycisphaerae bacterium]|nr:SUMF1/EgtB/PvdO family nonheme iron enzyme [Phycisphaerae bacterium]
MAEDRYSQWLGIEEGARPPDHYTLLGIARFCDDTDLIDTAAHQRLDLLDRYSLAGSRQSRDTCQQMMNEVARARVVLMNTQRREEYNRQLAGQIIDEPPAAEEVEEPTQEALDSYKQIVWAHLGKWRMDAHEERLLIAEAATLGINAETAVAIARRINSQAEHLARGKQMRTAFGAIFAACAVLAAMAVFFMFPPDRRDTPPPEIEDTRTGDVRSKPPAVSRQPTQPATRPAAKPRQFQEFQVAIVAMVAARRPAAAKAKLDEAKGLFPGHAQLAVLQTQIAELTAQLAPKDRIYQALLEESRSLAVTGMHEKARVTFRVAAGIYPDEAAAGELEKLIDSISAGLADINPARLTSLAKIDQAEAYRAWPFTAEDAIGRRDATARSVGIPPAIRLKLGKGPSGGAVMMRFLLIPAGRFVTGSSDVKVARPFYISATEVTRSQWSAVTGKSPWARKSNARGDTVHAANWISAGDAREFCKILSSRLSGLKVQVPNEAEWEYACRAGAGTAFSFGDEHTRLVQYAWYFRNSGGSEYPKFVARKKPNAFGLYDMHGNTAEWVQARRAGSYELRGGSIKDPSNSARSDHRKLTAGANDYSTGFRPVLKLADDPKPKPTTRIATTKPAVPIAGGWPFDSAEAKARQEAAARKYRITRKLVLKLGGSQNLALVLIPPGEFLMGSPSGEKSRGKDERLHAVSISRPFYIGITEVTQAQWKAVMTTDPWSGRAYGRNGSTLPANHIDSAEAASFCGWLSRKTGRKVRLPSEAQWEYACRAGSGAAYCFGDDRGQLGEYAWFADGSAKAKGPHPVLMKKPNAFGVYDMHGNVAEWCRDRYDPEFYKKSPRTDPVNAIPFDGGGLNVYRGGSFLFADACRSADRQSGAVRPLPSLITRLGFRVVVEIGKPSTGAKFIAERGVAKVYTTWPFDSTEAKRRQAATAAALGIKHQVTLPLPKGKSKMTFALIPAGTFVMGSPMTEKGRREDEVQHKVKITKPFYMSTTEITEAQWLGVTGSSHSLGQRRMSTLPVHKVAWRDAIGFCDRLKKKTGLQVQLPTEAQWEYACRAGSAGAYSFGGYVSELRRYATYVPAGAGGIARAEMSEVARKEANAFGLYDMHGNAFELCRDYYTAAYYSRSPDADPENKIWKGGRYPPGVMRGGSWLNEARLCRSAARAVFYRGKRSAAGLRVIFPLPDKAKLASPMFKAAAPRR